MDLAWYGHLKFRNHALWIVILASWGLALFRVHFPGSGKPHRVLRVDRAATESSSGMHHTSRLHHRRLSTVPIAAALDIAVSYGLIVAAVFFAFKF
jgi:hypothetical protein